MLGQDDFDKRLLARLKAYFHNRACKVFLVFDSLDPMGDRFRDGSFEVIRTPRDDFYANADDKVLEIVGEFLVNDDFKDDVSVVTDDCDLQEKVRSAIAYHARKRLVKVIRATDFSRRLRDGEERIASAGLTDKTEAENDSDSLKEELLKRWGEH